MAVRPNAFKKNHGNEVESVFAGARKDRKDRMRAERERRAAENEARKASFLAREELLKGKPVVVPVSDKARVSAFRAAVSMSNLFLEDLVGDRWIFSVVKRESKANSSAAPEGVSDLTFTPMVPKGKK